MSRYHSDQYRAGSQSISSAHRHRFVSTANCALCHYAEWTRVPPWAYTCNRYSTTVKQRVCCSRDDRCKIKHPPHTSCWGPNACPLPAGQLDERFGLSYVSLRTGGAVTQEQFTSRTMSEGQECIPHNALGSFHTWINRQRIHGTWCRVFPPGSIHAKAPRKLSCFLKFSRLDLGGRALVVVAEIRRSLKVQFNYSCRAGCAIQHVV